MLAPLMPLAPTGTPIVTPKPPPVLGTLADHIATVNTATQILTPKPTAPSTPK